MERSRPRLRGKLVSYGWCRSTDPFKINVDSPLLKEAQKLGKHRSKKQAINAALSEYIQRRKQQEILTLFGKMDYDKAYDYKRERRKR